MDKFELASQEECDQLEPYVDRVLVALGHPEALVTDESYVSDFLCFFDKIEAEEELKEARRKLGISFDIKDSVVDVASKLKDEEDD